MGTEPLVAVLPEGVRPHLADAVVAGGGRLVPPERARALVWTDTGDPEDLAATLAAHPRIEWVQLPWAGIERFVDAGVVTPDRTWTCGKGVYAEPVAEHALALTLALLRDLPERARASSWGRQSGVSLVGRHVVVYGAGGITEQLLRFLAPFDCRVTVIRNRADPVPGADEVRRLDDHLAVLATADVVVLALAVTPRTVGVIDAAALAAMPDSAVLVNVARGVHVVTDDIVAALRAGDIAGYATDVTDPEPLPDGHPIWDVALITPHTANTEAMAVPLIAERVTANVRRWIAGEPLLGLVDAAEGY